MGSVGDVRGKESLFDALHARLFELLEPLDSRLHKYGISPRWLCRLVGSMEPRYYERGMDWAHPLYVKPSDEFNPDNRRRANRALMETFLAVWDTVPEQRFGQFFMNLSRDDSETGFADTWEWKHQRWYDELNEQREIWTGKS